MLFFCFRALRGTPGATDGWSSTQKEWWGRANPMISLGNRFQVTVLRYPWKSQLSKNWLSCLYFLLFGALRGAPWVTDGWCTILEGSKGRINQRNLAGDRFQLIVPSQPMNKLAKQDKILMVSLVALVLWGWRQGWWMVNVPPLEGDGVGQIRRSY